MREYTCKRLRNPASWHNGWQSVLKPQVRIWIPYADRPDALDERVAVIDADTGERAQGTVAQFDWERRKPDEVRITVRISGGGKP